MERVDHLKESSIGLSANKSARLGCSILVACGMFLAPVSETGAAVHEVISISLRNAQKEFSSIEDVDLDVEIRNHSTSLAAGVILGPSVWKDHVQVVLDGRRVKLATTHGSGDDTYELYPGQSVRFLIPLYDYVLRWATERDALAAREFRGDYSVTVELQGSRSNPVTFTVSGEPSDTKAQSRLGHPKSVFVERQRARLKGRDGRNPLASEERARAVAHDLELFVLKNRRPSYPDPLDEQAIGRAVALLRECAGMDPSLRLNGSYLTAIDPFGSADRALIRAARLEHKAIDLVTTGSVSKGLSHYAQIFDLLPDSVVYHVGAVAQLSPLGQDWEGDRRRIAEQGVERIRGIGLRNLQPGYAFAYSYLASVTPAER